MGKSFKDRVYRLLIVLLAISLLGLVGYGLIRYFLPFLLALVISYVLHPIVSFFELKWGIHRAWASLFSMFLFFLTILLLSFLIIRQLIMELANLFTYLADDMDPLASLIQTAHLPFLDKILDYLGQLFPSQLFDGRSLFLLLLEKLNEHAASILQAALSFLSEVLASFTYTSFTLMFTFIATYFILKDFQILSDACQKAIPVKLIIFFSKVKDNTKTSVFAILKAQLIMAWITVSLAFLFLFLFRVNHLFLLSLILLLLDLIPYVGVGAVFLPWIAYSFLIGNYLLTIKLSLLYILLIIVRQMIEPRLLAKSLGLYPLMTIVILFTCFTFLGPLGILLAPIILILTSSLYHTRLIEYLVHYIKEGDLEIQ